MLILGLVELAKSNETFRDVDAVNTWFHCRQNFTGAFKMRRCFWRHSRSSPDVDLRSNSNNKLAFQLGNYGELDSAMLDEASKATGDDPIRRAMGLVDVKLKKNGRKVEALDLLNATLPEAKNVCTVVVSHAYYDALMFKADLLLELGRHDDALETATVLVSYSKDELGLDDRQTLGARRIYAHACARLHRREESSAIFNDILTTATRVFGRENPLTQQTRQSMWLYGFAIPTI